MTRLHKGFLIAAAGASLFASTLAAQAQQPLSGPAATGVEVAQNYGQNYGMPPDDVGGGGPGMSRGRGDEASLLIRVEKLEDQVRQLNGQLEQMQFTNKHLEDQLRKFQQDVDFRFQENSGRSKLPQKRGELDSNSPTQTAGADGQSGLTATPSTVPSRGKRHDDAFDPGADPDAPGAPHGLGNSAANNGRTDRQALANLSNQAADDDESGAPLELSSSPDRSRPPADPAANNQYGSNQYGSSSSGGPLTTTGGTIIANTQPNAAPINPVKEEFDMALGYMKQKDYEAAEKSFSSFLQKNPKTRYSAEAIYYLGETYYQRGRQREAAEQYLKISSNYANSSRAPEALLRLGQSLKALGAKEQACASFNEIARKYPNASASIKAAAERESKRVQC